MKKKYLLAALMLLLILVSVPLLYVWNRLTIAESSFRGPSHVSPIDSLVTIGIIGDSWTANKKLDSILNNRFHKAGIVTKVISSGHPGAPTRLVYQNLSKDASDEHSSRFILSSHPHYCIIVAGVNDSQGQFGKTFYAAHMRLMVEALSKCNI